MSIGIIKNIAYQILHVIVHLYLCNVQLI